MKDILQEKKLSQTKPAAMPKYEVYNSFVSAYSIDFKAVL